jgi:hypothetical protein
MGLMSPELKHTGSHPTRWFSSFSRKRSKKRCSASQKAIGYPKNPRSGPQKSTPLEVFWRRILLSFRPATDIGGWFSSFSRKRSKKRCSASQKTIGYPKSAKRTLGVWGRAPKNQRLLRCFCVTYCWLFDPRLIERDGFLLFPEKEAKSVGLLRRRQLATQNPRSGPWGFGGVPPKINAC